MRKAKKIWKGISFLVIGGLLWGFVYWFSSAITGIMANFDPMLSSYSGIILLAYSIIGLILIITGGITLARRNKLSKKELEDEKTRSENS